ncbi:biopolymer transporter ExbD [Hoeflea sp. WL0058]|uniref:Biopolymer transporter ExbD n=1 Tax=Flavimaribacter sediminis TaxID=2865987 RepID=A0AAE2ZQX3_9HYPH|nr:biopolymer transporter ExbD [Flavimaribacter sediminis]MBW8639301.1 biopolymer transporter ExbD [Flavimaribacter sediminis]
MLTLPRPAEKPPKENTIALINIVFLMLVFFLIAGSLAPPMEDIDLIERTDSRPVEPPRALFITAEAELVYEGKTITVENYVAGLKDTGAAADETGPHARIAADSTLPAIQLIDVIDRLRAAGVGRITVITERKMK